MRIVDVQILFYAIDPTSEHHGAALRWLTNAINGDEAVALTWPTIHQFLRLGTSLAYSGHMSDAEALDWIEEWLEAGVRVVTDHDVRWDGVRALLAASRRSVRNAVDDAHLAAIAISHRATLASFDRDFERFARHGLRLERLAS